MRFNPAHALSIPLEPQAHADEKAKTPIDIEAILPGYRDHQDGTQHSDFLLMPERAAIRPAKRLVVVVPKGHFNEEELAHKVWQLASTTYLPILFLSLSTDPDGAAYLRRRLVTIAAITAFGEVKATTSIQEGRGWLQAIQRILQPGDLLVCLSEHQVPFRLIGRKALGDILATSLHMPIYLIGDLQIDDFSYRPSQIEAAFSWFASFAIIIAFALLQTRIYQTTSDPASTILLCLSVILEFFLILKTNEWIG